MCSTVWARFGLMDGWTDKQTHAHTEMSITLTTTTTQCPSTYISTV